MVLVTADSMRRACDRFQPPCRGFGPLHAGAHLARHAAGLEIRTAEVGLWWAGTFGSRGLVTAGGGEEQPGAQGVGGIEHQLVEAGQVGGTGDGGDDRPVPAGNLRLGMDGAGEHGV